MEKTSWHDYSEKPEYINKEAQIKIINGATVDTIKKRAAHNFRYTRANMNKNKNIELSRKESIPLNSTMFQSEKNDLANIIRKYNKTGCKRSTGRNKRKRRVSHIKRNLGSGGVK